VFVSDEIYVLKVQNYDSELIKHLKQ
jgi:hypothetical protein